MSEITRQIAKMIDGRQYRNEVTKEIIELAKNNNIVIVFGASDDLMEFRGAIHDEVDCFEGGTAYITTDNELLESACLAVCNKCKYLKQALEGCKQIEALWCETLSNCSWTYKTTIPHETFCIWEDNEQCCIGIVFSLDDI